jgi:hypothetical protein
MKGQNKSLLNWKLIDFYYLLLNEIQFCSNAFHTVGHKNEAAWSFALFLISFMKADAISKAFPLSKETRYKVGD